MIDISFQLSNALGPRAMNAHSIKPRKPDIHAQISFNHGIHTVFHTKIHNEILVVCYHHD